MAVTNYYTVEGEIIGEKTAGNSRVDYLTDALGSVTATVNQSAQIVNTYRYKPYGSLLAKTGTGADPAFGWLGTHGIRPTQKKFSDFYARARHVAEDTGQWTTRDPLIHSRKDYVYVRSNPVTRIDPSGLALKGGTISGCSDDIFGYIKTNCCGNYMKKFTDPNADFINKIRECMAQKGYGDNAFDPISQTLNWIYQVCQEDDKNICVWCYDKGVRPSQYPCADSCKGSTGFTPTPVKGVPPIDVGRIINPYPGQDGRPLPCPSTPVNCRNAATIRDPKDPTKILETCTGAIVLCYPTKKNALYTCATFWHELTHAGGVGELPGHHGHGNDPGNDFVFAIECCLCNAFYGANECTGSCQGFGKQKT